MMPFHVEKAVKLVVEWLKPGFIFLILIFIGIFFPELQDELTTALPTLKRVSARTQLVTPLSA